MISERIQRILKAIEAAQRENEEAWSREEPAQVQAVESVGSGGLDPDGDNREAYAALLATRFGIEAGREWARGERPEDDGTVGQPAPPFPERAGGQ